MQERKGIVTLKGNSVTLVGREVSVGDTAPDFVAVDNDMSEVHFADLKSDVTVITSVPSLDTEVCDRETRRFNVEAAALGEKVRILAISMDLPFAQKRWCAAAGVEAVRTLSDYRFVSFGASYGVLIKEIRLLARAVFVVDADGTVRYVQIVPEIAREPNYKQILAAVKQMV